VNRTRMLLVAMAAVVGLTACNDRDEAEQTRLGADPMEEARAGWPEDLRARIDSGNAAYRAGQYDEAAAVYRRATERHPDVSAAWFGLHMAEAARGNDAAADSARMRAEGLTPGLGGGHPSSPTGELPDGELPAGHPPVNGDLPAGHPPVDGGY
jgi:tetratricopeptide (TPR) repeat protein